MLRQILLASALVALTANAIFAQAPTKPVGKRLDLAYIPSNALGVLVFHPHRVFTAPQAKWWPTEIISAYSKKELGFDPLQVEQAVIVLGAMQGGPGDSVGFILRFQKPIDVEKIARKIVRDGKEEKIEGLRGWMAQNEFQPSIAFSNDRTAIVSTKPYLTALLTAKPGDGSVQKMLAAADDSAGAAIYLTLEPIRPTLTGMMLMLANVGPAEAVQDLVDLPAKIDTLQIAANFATGGDGFVFDVKLGTRDAETAENVVGTVKRSFKQVQTFIMEQISAGRNDENSEELEVKVASMKYVERVADGILASLNPKASGSDVTMNAEVLVGPLQMGYLSSTFAGWFYESQNVGIGRPDESQNNLKQIALNFLNHEDKHKSMPAVANYDKAGKPLLSWRVHMLPEMGEEALYKEFHLDEPWDSEHNKKLIEKMPDVYKHPQFNEPGKTVYLAVVGKGAAFEGKKGNRLASFTDGTSTTITVIEVAPAKAVPWTKPEDYEFDPEKAVDFADFGVLRDGELFYAVFADGHVEAFMTQVTDPEMVKKMFTRAGGEVIEANPPPAAIPVPLEVQP